MADSDEAFLVKGKEKIETSTQMLFHVSKSRTNLGFQDKSENITSHIVSGSSGTTLEEEEEEENGYKVVPSLGGLLAGNEEDKDESGFKTPTSPDHKIPGLTLCPGAPRKPTSHFSARKRKASSSSSTTSSSSPSLSPSRTPPQSSGVRRSLLLDLSQEVESLFPRPVLADTHRERKRARSGGGDGGNGDS